MQEFEKGNSIYFQCEYRDFDGTLTDPTTPTYEIKDSKGNKEDSGTPTKDTIGIYYFVWTSVVVDDYFVEFTGTIGKEVGVVRKKFRVKEVTI